MIAPLIEELQSIDAALCLWVNGWQGISVVDAFFLYGTDLGTSYSIVAVVVAFLARNGLTQAQVLRLVYGGFTGALAGILNGVLKWYIQRPRPPQVVPEIRVIGPMLWGHSFPSGHTALAFILLGILWHLDRKLGWVWLPFAVIVGVSRIYLGVHFPSDVIVGALVGFVPTYFLLRRLQGRAALV